MGFFILISIFLSIWVLNRIEQIQITFLPFLFLGVLFVLPIVLQVSWILKTLNITTYRNNPVAIKNLGATIERKLWSTSFISLILYLAVGNLEQILPYFFKFLLFFLISTYIPVIAYYLFIQEHYAKTLNKNIHKRFKPKLVNLAENTLQ